MSYSFGVTAPTKAEAKDQVFTKFTEVCDMQKIHAVDAEAANAAAAAFIDCLPDSETHDVNVSVHGSVSWSGNMDAQNITAASVGVSASLVARAAAAIA